MIIPWHPLGGNDQCLVLAMKLEWSETQFLSGLNLSLPLMSQPLHGVDELAQDEVML